MNTFKSYLCIAVQLLLFSVFSNIYSTNFAYIGSTEKQELYVIDTDENDIIEVIPISSTALSAAVSPDGKYVFVALDNELGVSVLETETNLIINNIPVPGLISGITFLPNGNSVYVATVIDTIFVINATTHEISDQITLRNAEGIVAHPDSSKVYVARQGSVPGKVAVIDTASNTVSTEIVVGANPDGIDILPDGSQVYVSNQVDGTVSIIDTATNTVLSTLTSGYYPLGVATDLYGEFVYVVNLGSMNISVIDPDSLSIVDFIPLNGFYLGVDVHPDGDLIYAVGQGVAVIDLNTKVTIKDIPIDSAVSLGAFITPFIPESLDDIAIEMQNEMTLELTNALNDPDLPKKAKKDIEKALENIVGKDHKKGKIDKHSAVNELLDGDVDKALHEMEKAAKDLEKAHKDGYDTTLYQEMLIDYARRIMRVIMHNSIQLLGLDHNDIKKAQDHIDDAEEEILEQDYEKALKEFKDAAKDLGY